MKRWLPAAVLAAALFCFAGCGAAAPETVPETPPAPPQETEPEILPPTAEELTAQKVDALLSTLSLEEKVGQLFFVRVPEDSADTDIKQYHLGGYILFGRDTKEKTASELILRLADYQSHALADTGIPMLLGVDEEGGTVVRVSSNPNLRREKYKSPRQLYEQGGMETVISEVRERDVLLKALGFNVNLFPVCDVSTDPGDFMYERSIGLSGEDTAAYAAQAAAQMAKDGMGSVLKHFPGYGNNLDTHTGIAVDTRPMESFETSDFLPFSAGIDGGNQESGQSAAVLISHNIVRCMDADLPASLSPEVHRILREELGFDGVVMTDDLAMDAVAAYAKDGSDAVMALRAGNDLVVTTDYRRQIPLVLDAVKSGALDEAVIDTACRRLLTWKSALGLI